MRLTHGASLGAPRIACDGRSALVACRGPSSRGNFLASNSLRAWAQDVREDRSSVAKSKTHNESADGIRVITTNRKARYDYQILETIEAGISLLGTEVKSLRAGRVNLKDSYVEIRGAEIFLVGAHISPYEEANRFNHEPERQRRLLMHRREILRFGIKAREKGLTLVPLRLYFKSNRVKVELGLARGKRMYDKRQAIAKRDAKRELDRALKEAKRG